MGKWIVESYEIDSKTGGKNAHIWEGVNPQGDGPDKRIGIIDLLSDAEEVCRLHNESIDKGEGK